MGEELGQMDVWKYIVPVFVHVNYWPLTTKVFFFFFFFIYSFFVLLYYWSIGY